MYLVYLNEQQKKLFLDLCIFISNSDGDFSETEKEHITLYCNEMQLPVRFEAIIDNVDSVISELATISSKREFKIIYFETLALVLCDSVCDENELAIIDKLGKSFNLDNDEQTQLSDLLKEMLTITKKVNSAVLN